MNGATMENGVSVDDTSTRMGATSNPHADRLAALKERRKELEERLEKRVKELRELCIQEADLTGIVPREMPLEPGETLPSVRRRVGTAYQLPENLIKNADSDETIEGVELQLQVHTQLAEAALGLANEVKSSKTIKKQHFQEYQKHKQQCKVLRDKLANLKEREQQNKLKKKTREPQEDSISVTTLATEPFVKSDLRHSLRSLKAPDTIDNRYAARQSYRNSDSSYMDAHIMRPDDGLTSGFYGLNLNSYKNYMERRENVHYMPTAQYADQQLLHHSPQSYQHHRSSQPPFNYIYPPPPEMNRYSYISPSPPVFRQSSPNSSKYYNTAPYTTQSQTNIRHYSDSQYRNPHQIQPHQQYEQSVMSSGLGGCWKSTETGEMVWCNSTHETSWDRDKRFGSLDRRKNKKIHKRVSPDSKSATLASVPSYTDHVRIASVKSHMLHRRTDNRQLIRTQSLGSVGAQTLVDSICPSDDNSSCNSDNHSINELSHHMRKAKEKEWVETSLDGPVSPTHSIASHSLSTIPPHSPLNILPPPPPPLHTKSIISPDEKYHHQPLPPPPLTPKPPLEIPAESNRSPRIPDNLEMFNNNIPENCTVVQAGYEETKPFEMSDFYKYSTKFKKSPVKADNPEVKTRDDVHPKKLPFSYDELPVKPPQYRTSTSSISMNSPSAFFPDQSSWHEHQLDGNSNKSLASPNMSGNSLSLSQITVSDSFATEMNAWYNEHEPQIDNNNENGGPKPRSTATLV